MGMIFIFALILFVIMTVPGFAVGVFTLRNTKKKKADSKRMLKQGIMMLVCIIFIPALILALLFGGGDLMESLMAFISIALVYALFPIVGFLSGYYAVKKNNWWIGVLGIVVLLIIFSAIGWALILSGMLA